MKANVERFREKHIALFCLRQSLRNISSYSKSCDSFATIHHCHDVGRKRIYAIVIHKLVTCRLTLASFTLYIEIIVAPLIGVLFYFI